MDIYGSGIISFWYHTCPTNTQQQTWYEDNQSRKKWREYWESRAWYRKVFECPRTGKTILSETPLNPFQLYVCDFPCLEPKVVRTRGRVLTLSIRICAYLLGRFFAKFGIAIGGFSSEMMEPKLHKLGVFWATYCKKHPIWAKLGAFLSKNGRPILMGGKLGKKLV